MDATNRRVIGLQTEHGLT